MEKCNHSFLGTLPSFLYQVQNNLWPGKKLKSNRLFPVSKVQRACKKVISTGAKVGGELCKAIFYGKKKKKW